jgi:hypothetical protein
MINTALALIFPPFDFADSDSLPLNSVLTEDYPAAIKLTLIVQPLLVLAIAHHSTFFRLLGRFGKSLHIGGAPEVFSGLSLPIMGGPGGAAAAL